MKLFPHQAEALELARGRTRVAFYHDMGLGKTFTGSEKMMSLGAQINLIVCQKSKVNDWIEHFKAYYAKESNINICDLTKNTFWKNSEFETALSGIDYWWDSVVFVINYDLIWRRPELKKLKHFTLLLDESSLVQNETAKRSRFILKLEPQNVILLSGTPTGGKYERLWSQMRLLGWNISKKMFYGQYVRYHYEDNNGFPYMVIDGYKNEDRLKQKMRAHGCQFLKTEEVIDLPDQLVQTIKVPNTREYRVFQKKRICKINETELVGDTTLTKMLCERQLCGQYNKDKLDAFRDLLESTEDRLIVFYNFNAELDLLWNIANENDRPVSIINGKEHDTFNYGRDNNSITFIQYQAGAMGLNLQKANKIVYFTPPLSSELFEQSKKRIHRIGQEKTCFYYELTCSNSIEEKIYRALAMRKDYTEALFEEDENGN